MTIEEEDTASSTMANRFDICIVSYLCVCVKSECDLDWTKEKTTAQISARKASIKASEDRRKSRSLKRRTA
jgi:hypothetical protein